MDKRFGRALVDTLTQVQFSLDIFRDMKRREGRSSVPESDESEPDTGSDSGSSDGSSAEYDEEDLNEDVSSAPSEVPLYMRLAEQNTDAAITAAAREKVQRRRNKDAAKEARTGGERVGIGMLRKSKNAPAEMPSNRPVRRLRVDANNSIKKSIDPRFSDAAGKLDEQIFSKNYSFLDDYRDNEIDVLSKAVKKIKNPNKKEEVKTELLKMKQQAKERKRGLRVMERLDSIRAEEREKVKQGKKPFFLKNSAKNTISLEEKYKELRKEGKLHKFMEKRRKKNSSKDHRFLPMRRTGSAGGAGDD